MTEHDPDFIRYLAAVREVKILQQQNLDLFEDNCTLVQENDRLKLTLARVASSSPSERKEFRKDQYVQSLKAEMKNLEEAIRIARKKQSVTVIAPHGTDNPNTR